MHLVDDIDLVFTLGGRVGYLVADLSDVVHAVVGGCVHLHHVQNAAVVDASADLALTAGVTVLGMQAVDCLGKYFCDGCLTGSSRSTEQICMADTVCLYLVL